MIPSNGGEIDKINAPNLSCDGRYVYYGFKLVFIVIAHYHNLKNRSWE